MSRNGGITGTGALRAPFPWFGGKSRVAHIVWEAFGDLGNYVEPFFGSGAVLLGRPNVAGIETINDMDGFVANFWRAVAADPDAVAKHADWPVSEADLHARHLWLVDNREDLTLRLMADPAFFDARVAGWWVWGICSWIGSGWCSGNGPWKSVDGRLARCDAGKGINRKRPHMSDAGHGINRKLPHMGDAGQGVTRKRPHMGNDGQGINRQRPHLGDAGQGINRQRTAISEWFSALGSRLRDVRIACGDWARVTGESVTTRHPGITGVFLDPPYADTADRTAALYAIDSLSVAHSVREWAIANGGHNRMRIALCGYEGEHAMPPDWQCIAWKASGGQGSQTDSDGRVNATRERIWLSPACLPVSHEAHLNSAHTKQLTQIAKAHKTTADLRATMLRATKNLKQRSS